MLQLCVVLLCFLTTDVVGTRNANDSIGPPVSPIPISNKSVDNSTILVNTSLPLENAANNTTILINTSSEPAVTKIEETPKLMKKDRDQPPPTSGIFSRTPTGAALRGLYVFVGLSAVVMLYIAVKLIRLRRKKMRIRKYGLIANADDVEMTPLGDDDDDEDTTLFDAHNHIGR